MGIKWVKIADAGCVLYDRFGMIPQCIDANCHLLGGRREFWGHIDSYIKFDWSASGGFRFLKL